MEKILIARWESRSGKYWVELYEDTLGYTYSSDDAGGNLGKDWSEAYNSLRDRIQAGCFQPDNLKTPMKRVF